MLDTAYADALHGLLKRFTYKPGWAVDVWDDIVEHDTVWLCLQFTTTDAEGKVEGPIRIGRKSAFPPLCYDLWVALGDAEMWRSYAYHWIVERIKSLECHEADEWAKVDGVPVNPTGHARALTP